MAEVLGVQPSTIYQWTHQGYIPHIKIGKFVRFKEKDVEKWVEKKVNNGRETKKIDLRMIESYNRL
ncbi:MAG: hypothetical protein CVT49_00740 [candidate division Zixibacteria bacterium HGW-Zixibacteria-1]|nr:MAG: hypothetical protein CVT49_00740 [candidate division Zixibacteria bacterium HGW-Zixibacteria-1]